MGSHRRCTGGERRRGRREGRKQRDGCLSRLLAFSLLLLLLSVCDDVADVLVVYVAGHIWGEGGPHVLNLREEIGVCEFTPSASRTPANKTNKRLGLKVLAAKCETKKKNNPERERVDSGSFPDVLMHSSMRVHG